MPPWVCAHSDTPTPPFPRLTHAHCPSFPLHPHATGPPRAPLPWCLCPRRHGTPAWLLFSVASNCRPQGNLQGTHPSLSHSTHGQQRMPRGHPTTMTTSNTNKRRTAGRIRRLAGLCCLASCGTAAQAFVVSVGPSPTTPVSTGTRPAFPLRTSSGPRTPASSSTGRLYVAQVRQCSRSSGGIKEGGVRFAFLLSLPRLPCGVFCMSSLTLSLPPPLPPSTDPCAHGLERGGLARLALCQ